ncbi:cadherin isoform X1 [Ciona intestinalis]
MRGVGSAITLVIVISLQIILPSEGKFFNKLINLAKRNRVKRSWSYPVISIPETIDQDPPFVRKNILDITNDNPNVKTYELQNEDPTKFAIEFSAADPNAGASIWQLVGLDRDVPGGDRYIFYAVVRDAAGNELDRVTLEVAVTDRNDNTPIFDTSTLQGSVQEGVSPGTPVMTVVANDADDPNSLDKNGLVSYLLGPDAEEPPAPGGRRRFAISSTGVITVVGDLDIETAPTVNVVIIAKDGFVGSSSGRSASATATIQIRDANDNKPVFQNTPYNAKKGELLPLRSTVFTVSATDKDIDLENKGVSFEIVAGNDDNTFIVQSYPRGAGASSGDIILNKPLDYENGPKQYTLLIKGFNAQASNSDVQQFQTTETVIVNVLDENEPPVFINQPYAGNIVENDVAKPNIAFVRAQDYDFGGNQTVTYGMVSTEGWFTIATDGAISSVGPVDREHPSVNQTNSVYTLVVSAIDNYRVKATATANVAITIGDKNDNAPEPDGPWTVTICEKPPTPFVTNIKIKDLDEPQNGAPFSVSLNDNSGLWVLETVSGDPMSRSINTLTKSFDVAQQSKYEVPIIMSDGAKPPEPKLTSTNTLVINICRCEERDDGEAVCLDTYVAPGGINIVLIVAIIAALILILIIVLAVVAYRRRQQAGLEKEVLLDDDDVRENLQAYHDEGGGEEDNDGYDISALQAQPPNTGKPKVVDVQPLGGAQPEIRRPIQPDTDIGNYIGDAKQQADNDPTAPPFDSLLVFDYEGQGSDAGSLSSLNSGTTDASQDYDYLNNWGPRFKKLADMYGGGESD